ncbi:MAG: CoA transferase [Pseudomonadales bacterium]|nr:MAG: CoA transferase [Pseudomonadales bacterium]
MKPVLPSNTHVYLPGNAKSSQYGKQLLEDLGATVALASLKTTEERINRWETSGLGELTGFPEAPLLECPVPLAEYGDGVLDAFTALLGHQLIDKPCGADLMATRASHYQFFRQGNLSLSGSCRILPCSDGHIAINLARDSDWELLPAWLLNKVTPEWTSLELQIRAKTTEELVNQGRLLGLAVTNATPPIPTARNWYTASQIAAPINARTRPPRVIDLSSLWAGPLCSRLLQWSGAEVIKVEDSHRPDGARFGSKSFFHFLNSGKTERTLSLKSNRGQEALKQLIRSADIVIEGSRPRALRQMGIIAEQLLEEVPGLCWLSISGYGRNDPEANWIAYGDDAGIAAGLSRILKQHTGKWMIAGDAIADPLTGMHAALAALACWRAGGGQLMSLSLVETIQHCIAFSGAGADLDAKQCVF